MSAPCWIDQQLRSLLDWKYFNLPCVPGVQNLIPKPLLISTGWPPSACPAATVITDILHLHIIELASSGKRSSLDSLTVLIEVFQVEKHNIYPRWPSNFSFIYSHLLFFHSLAAMTGFLFFFFFFWLPSSVSLLNNFRLWLLLTI